MREGRAPIVVPGMNARGRALERWFSQKRAAAPLSHLNHVSDLGSRAVQGYACIYERPLIHDAAIKMFEWGCFGDSVHCGAKSILFDHDERDVIGTTADGLEFCNNPHGLVYRMPLAGCSRRSDVIRGVETGSKGCTSVGCEIVEKRQVEIGGVELTLITKAKLIEVSLVPQGAVSGTSSTIVDLAKDSTPLWIAARSSAFELDKCASNRVTDGRRLVDRLARLERLVTDLV